MANTTIKGAHAIHGQNPQYLIENVIRNRIYESNYWKEHCFALSAASLIDKAIELRYVGGVYGNQRPTEFLCLLQKLLQIQPEKEILIEYLQVDEFKYLRALAAMYIRMTFSAAEVYNLLEPLYRDYRKLRLRSMTGYSILYMDEFADALLTQERVCDIILPRITKRSILEDLMELGPRKSTLLDIMEGKMTSVRENSGSVDDMDEGETVGGPNDKLGSDVEMRGRSSRGSSQSLNDARYVSRSRSASLSERFRSRSRSISADRTIVST